MRWLPSHIVCIRSLYKNFCFSPGESASTLVGGYINDNRAPANFHSTNGPLRRLPFLPLAASPACPASRLRMLPPLPPRPPPQPWRRRKLPAAAKHPTILRARPLLKWTISEPPRVASRKGFYAQNRRSWTCKLRFGVGPAVFIAHSSIPLFRSLLNFFSCACWPVDCETIKDAFRSPSLKPLRGWRALSTHRGGFLMSYWSWSKSILQFFSSILSAIQKRCHCKLLKSSLFMW